ncbi:MULTISPECIES: helix-turn-helix domain-containing protein [Streptococcus]|jgi:transcriptional regulator|uniref:Transcriptional regulator n=1 Tax=Streptococcus viridans TaxID=78535 RepID=A0A447Z400_9STRE|nr:MULTISPECIES: helix-turn-helix transcriptional regulator [Streptococcus]VED67047.1 transcriptional regulator [Streptococcus viridans]VEE19972.1 transcriptional regulator [Streptococcus australis]
MNRLKELRQEKKLSQKELAEILRVHYRTLQNWENGESQIKPEKAKQLADFFNVSVGYLLGYDTKISELQNDLLISTKGLERTISEAFSQANSYFELQTQGIVDTIDLLIEGVKNEQLPPKQIVEALEFIKESAKSLDEIVDKMTEYQAKYTAENLLRYRLENKINKNNKG